VEREAGCIDHFPGALREVEQQDLCANNSIDQVLVQLILLTPGRRDDGSTHMRGTDPLLRTRRFIHQLGAEHKFAVFFVCVLSLRRVNTRRDI
jgi:hypothetical protein